MGKLWIFDFDGTLVDSEVAIKHCYFKVTEKLLPERINFVKNILIGPTLEETVSMILTKNHMHLKQRFIEKFQTEYDNNLVLTTPMYPGASTVIKDLKKSGDTLGILTNKRFLPTYKLINYFKWSDLFDWVACVNEYPHIKNKTELLDLQNINYDQYNEKYLVGDTVNDGLTANNKNIKFIKANYGYGNEQDWEHIQIYKKINSIKELKKL